MWWVMGKGEIKDFPQASGLTIQVDNGATEMKCGGTVSRLKGSVMVGLDMLSLDMLSLDVLSLDILRHPS